MSTKIGDFILSKLITDDGKILYGVLSAYDEYGNLEPSGSRILSWFNSREEALNWINNEPGGFD